MIDVRHLSPGRFGEPLLEVRMARGVRSYPSALKWLLGGFAMLMLGVSIGFALAGAVPVLGFAGLELVLLFVFLRLSFRRASAEEGVRVAGDDTVVSRDGIETARLQSYWLQVERAAQGLVLRSRNQRVAVGVGLAADEVDDLARAVRDALRRAKSGPVGC